MNANVDVCDRDGIGITLAAVGLLQPVSELMRTNCDLTDECGLGSCGVLKSTDGGSHWLEPKPGLRAFSGSGVTALAVDPQTPGTVFAAIATAVKGKGGGLWKSVDGGANWRNVFPANVYTVAINPQELGRDLWRAARMVETLGL